MAAAEEEEFYAGVLRIRECREPIVYVISTDGTRKRWMGGPTITGRCGKLYPDPRGSTHRRMLACEKCADDPIFWVSAVGGVRPEEGAKTSDPSPRKSPMIVRRGSRAPASRAAFAMS